MDLGQIEMLTQEDFQLDRPGFIRTVMRSLLGTQTKAVRQTVGCSTLALRRTHLWLSLTVPLHRVPA